MRHCGEDCNNEGIEKVTPEEQELLLLRTSQVIPWPVLSSRSSCSSGVTLSMPSLFQSSPKVCYQLFQDAYDVRPFKAMRMKGHLMRPHKIPHKELANFIQTQNARIHFYHNRLPKRPTSSLINAKG